MNIKKSALVAVLSIVVALSIFGTVFAQTGTTRTTSIPVVPEEITIAEILANPVRDQVVKLTGTITKLIEGNDFILTDSTGDITVSGGPAWFQQLGLTEGQSVTLIGEVDLGKPDQAATTPEIDLFSFESGGQTNTIQQGGGPPPWAGGPHRQGLPSNDNVDDND
jgi:uncharacterized protein YdeI (BOF family)